MHEKKINKIKSLKINRSEMLHTRISPPLRFMLEIMARHENHTVSSFMEKLVQKTAEDYSVPVVFSQKAQTDLYLLGDRKYKKLSVKAVTDRIWSPEAADRFVLFALFLPDLLNADEACVWQLIVECPYFWQNIEMKVENASGRVIDRTYWPRVDYGGLVRAHLREHWPLLEAILQGKASVDAFRQLQLPRGPVVKKPEDYPIKKMRSK